MSVFVLFLIFWKSFVIPMTPLWLELHSRNIGNHTGNCETIPWDGSHVTSGHCLGLPRAPGGCRCVIFKLQKSREFRLVFHVILDLLATHGTYVFLKPLGCTCVMVHSCVPTQNWAVGMCWGTPVFLACLGCAIVMWHSCVPEGVVL